MSIRNILTRIALPTIFSMLACSTSVHAADYPQKPVHLIAPIAVGGLTDTLARLVANGLSQELGQSVVVENKPGGGGIIGMQAAAKADPDGYTMILVYQGVAVVNTSLYDDLPYDTQRDFTPVAGLGSFPMVLVTHPGTGLETISEVLERLRTKPDSLSYASAGNATTSHLSMELFKNQTGVEITHIPYKGEGPANTDVAGGQVDITFSSLASVISLIKDERLVPLGIATLESSPILLDVPTVATEVSGFEAVGWYGLLAPAGTPDDIVNILSDATARVLQQPDIQEKLRALGVTANATSASEFGEHLESETVKWRRVIQSSGITVD